MTAESWLATYRKKKKKNQIAKTRAKKMIDTFSTLHDMIKNVSFEVTIIKKGLKANSNKESTKNK